MKRREPLPDLSHVFEDSRPYAVAARPGPAPALRAVEKRIHTRFDKIFLVVVGSELYGDSFAIARNVSAGGILAEMCYAPPLGTIVTVHFQAPRLYDDADPADPDAPPRIDEIVVRSEVKHHHYLNFSGSGEAAKARAIGLRFLEFVDLGERVDPRHVH